MLNSIFGYLFGVLIRTVMSILIWILLFPVAVILATPFILIIAAFDGYSYFRAVGDRYDRFYHWWMTSNEWWWHIDL